MKFDLYGAAVQLMFNGEYSHKTRVGSCVTFIIVSCIIGRLSFLLYQANLRINPLVLYQERYVAAPAMFPLSHKNFQVAFGLQDQMGNYYYDPSLFQCTPEVFEEASEPVKQYFTSQLLEQKYCIDLGIDNLQIQGDFNTPAFQDIYIHFSKCIGDGCQPIDKVDSFLSNVIIDMAFSDIYIDPTNFNNPFVPYGRDQFWEASSTSSSSVSFYMRNNYVQSDHGWLFQDLQTQVFPSYSYDSLELQYSTSNTFMEIIILLEKAKENYYQRQYTTIFDIISQIGGFSQSLLAIGAILCSQYSKVDFKLTLINELFTIQKKKKKLQSESNKQDNLKSVIFNKNGTEPPIEEQKNRREKSQSTQLNILKDMHSRIFKNSVSPNQDNLDKSLEIISSIKPVYRSEDVLLKQNFMKDSLGKRDSSHFSEKKIQKKPFKTIEKKTINFKLPSLVTTSEQPLKTETPLTEIQSPNNQIQKNLLVLSESPNNLRIKSCEQAGSNQVELQEDCLKYQQFKEKQKDQLQCNQNNITQPNKELGQMKDRQQPDSSKIINSTVKPVMERQNNNSTPSCPLAPSLNSTFKFSFLDILRGKLFPLKKCQKKKRNAEQQINYLNQQLDIKYVMRQLMEFQKLKRILLDPLQLDLLSLISKPTLLLDSENLKSVQLVHELSTTPHNMTNNLIQNKSADCLYKLLNKIKLSEIDRRILSNLNPVILSEAKQKLEELGIVQSKEAFKLEECNLLSPEELTFSEQDDQLLNSIPKRITKYSLSVNSNSQAIW